MIEYKTGDLLKSDAQALVNAVNTVGVMGKGIALQFRQAFPDNYAAYRDACKQGRVCVGEMFMFATGADTNPRLIINFPTKRDWRSKSRMADIETGLNDLLEVVRREQITSIAVPPLGCGNGGLEWKEVHPLIRAAFATMPQVRVALYPPPGASIGVPGETMLQFAGLIPLDELERMEQAIEEGCGQVDTRDVEAW